jgi:hypothetical protein
MSDWFIGSKHPAYGKVAMMRTIEGEPYRFFVDKNGSVAMIPLKALQDMEAEK